MGLGMPPGCHWALPVTHFLTCALAPEPDQISNKGEESDGAFCKRLLRSVIPLAESSPPFIKLFGIFPWITENC